MIHTQIQTHKYHVHTRIFFAVIWQMQLSFYVRASERKPVCVYSHFSLHSHLHCFAIFLSHTHNGFKHHLYRPRAWALWTLSAHTHQTKICQWPGNCYFIEMYAIPKHLLTKVPLPEKNPGTLTRIWRKKQPKNHITKQWNGTYFSNNNPSVVWSRFGDLSHAILFYMWISKRYIEMKRKSKSCAFLVCLALNPHKNYEIF